MKTLKFLLAAVVATVAVCSPAYALNDGRLKRYALAATLEATADPDGTMAYAIDTDVHYLRANGAWSTVTTLATMANGATWTNAVDGTVVLTEGGEDLTFAATANLWTIASTTGATFGFTPAVALADSLTFSDGAVLDQSANNVIGITENSEDITFTFAANSVTVASTTGSLFTFTPAVTFSDSITFSDGAVVDQAANGSLSIVEAGETLSFDFTANLVDIDAGTTGGSSVTITTASTFQVLNAGITAGWTAPTGANTACATTCAGTGACAFGLDTGGVLVDCAGASADSCICLGPSS